MLIELIHLSERMEFTGREPFAPREIHWMIDLDEAGNLHGISPTVRISPGEASKKKDERGKPFSCPTSFYMKVDNKGKISATSGGGNVPALLGIGRTIEVFGQELIQEKAKTPEVTEVSSAKDKKRRANFVTLHQKFAADYPANKSAAAVFRFLRSNPQLIPAQFFPKKPAEKKNEQTQNKSSKADANFQLAKLNSEYLTFRIARRPLLKDKDFIAWWTKYYNDQWQPVLSALPEGTDLLSGHSGKLAKVFPHIAGVPNGGGYCPLASFDKEPSQSYGLRDMTAPMLLENAEKAAAALNWLLREDTTHLRLGSDVVAVFWAVDLSKPEEKPKGSPFATLLADPLEVRDFLRSPNKAMYQEIDQTAFYAAILSSPQSRVTVRNWHTSTLPEADRHLREYFAAISLTSDKDSEEILTFPIGLLANVTIVPRKKGDKAKPQPDTYITLFECAMFGASLPHKLLSKALRRQSLELANGTDKKNQTEFEKRLAARTALVKLYFKRAKGVEMTPGKHSIENDAAYLCGRLLAMLDRIHVTAHEGRGGTNSSPANRAYGSASTTPALAFPQLCKLARHHLNKMGGGMARNLEFGVNKRDRTDGTNDDFEGLAAIVARLLRTTEQQFPRTLTLEDQGRFAIGFYYERSLPIPRTMKAKAGDNSSASNYQAPEQERKGDAHNEQ